MAEQPSLRTTIAEPLQSVARELRPLAEREQAYIDSYNALCDVLEGFHEKLLSRTGKGLNRDWNKLSSLSTFGR